jgi:hypothetical protein
VAREISRSGPMPPANTVMLASFFIDSLVRIGIRSTISPLR